MATPAYYAEMQNSEADSGALFHLRADGGSKPVAAMLRDQREDFELGALTPLLGNHLEVTRLRARLDRPAWG